MKITARQEILRVLSEVGRPLAVHEFGIKTHSENNLATRLSELAATGQVVGSRREGKAYKEWRLVP